MYTILIRYFTKNNELIIFFKHDLPLNECIKAIDIWVMNNADRNIYSISIHQDNGICILSLNKNDFIK